MQSNMAGWIKLHRSCLSHWLYTEHRPLTKREAWETILLTVNYEKNTSLIKGQIYECLAGQSILSLDGWSKRFGWSIQQVRTFFKLLEKDEMIKIEGLQYTTRLTVCKWANYQEVATDGQQTANTPLTNQQQTANTPLTTIKEEEESKEEEEEEESRYYAENFISDLVSLGVQKNVAKEWIKVRRNKKATNSKIAFNAIKNQIALSGLSANECVLIAIENSWSGFKSEWVNNLFSSKPQGQKPKSEQMCIMTSLFTGGGKEIEKPYRFYEKELRDFGSDNVKLIRML